MLVFGGQLADGFECLDKGANLKSFMKRRFGTKPTSKNNTFRLFSEASPSEMDPKQYQQGLESHQTGLIEGAVVFVDFP